MKIAIDQEVPTSFFYAVGRVLSEIGDNVYFWNKKEINIYNLVHGNRPDLVIINIEHQKDIKFLIDNNIKYITYGSGAAIDYQNVPAFVDTISYHPPITEDESYKTDILFSSNFFNGDPSLLSKIDHVFSNTDLKIKCAGNTWIPSPIFIGFANSEEFMKIAKSSKVVVTSCPIEKISLLNSKIYCVLIEELDTTIVNETKLIRKIVKEEREKISSNCKTSIEYVKTLCNEIGLMEQFQKLQTIGIGI